MDLIPLITEALSKLQQLPATLKKKSTDTSCSFYQSTCRHECLLQVCSSLKEYTSNAVSLVVFIINNQP